MNDKKKLNMLLEAIDYSFWNSTENDYNRELTYPVIDKVKFIKRTLQEEPVSEDLEEEIQKTIHNHFFDLNGIAIAGTSVYATVDDMVYIAKHFANWQKEQMMKDAIDTERTGVEVNDWKRKIVFSFALPDKDYEKMNKVKVIIIKNKY